MGRKLMFRAACFILATALLLGQTATVITRTGYPESYGGPYDVYYTTLPTTLTSIDTRASHILQYCVYNSTGSALTLTIQTQDATPNPLPYNGSLPATTAYCLNAGTIGMPVNGWSIKSSATGAYYSATWTH